MTYVRSNKGQVEESHLDKLVQDGKDQASHEAQLAVRKEWQHKFFGTYGDCEVTKEGVEDSCGNWLFSLPLEEPANFKEWLDEEFQAFCEYGE